MPVRLLHHTTYSTHMLNRKSIINISDDEERNEQSITKSQRDNNRFTCLMYEKEKDRERQKETDREREIERQREIERREAET